MADTLASRVPDQLAGWQQATANLEIRPFLEWALNQFAPRLGFASSLGLEDQVLLHLLDELAGTAPEHRGLEAFTLDTGRLFPETWELLERNHQTYRLRLRLYAPEARELEDLVARQGPNGFYHSVAQRQACCAVRKIQPLQRALAGKTAWITGLRRGQGPTRSRVERVEWDAAHGLVKLNPLADWTIEQVQAFAAKFGVPVNALHQRGFPSIGCQPCTRAVAPGQDERAGRWWWEAAEHKECGLHRPARTGARKPLEFGVLGRDTPPDGQ